MIQNIMHTSTSGLKSNRDAISLTGNNIVNANTSGYKRLESQFQTLVSHNLDRDSYPNYSKDVQTGTGIRTSEAFRITDQGSLKNTGDFFNFCLVGEGYFRMVLPDGSYAYTRSGEFSVDKMGRIVDDFGNLLDIVFEEGFSYDNIDFSNTSDDMVNITGMSNRDGIDKDGYIRIDGTLIGRINIYNTVGDDDLRSIRDNLFVPKDGVNMVQSKSTYMRQGYLELSNSNLVDELTNLMTLQRAYQLNSKGVSTADEMWALVNEM